MKDKIRVRSLVSGRVVLYAPDANIKRALPRKGAMTAFTAEQFEQLSYTNGFRYMVDHAIVEVIGVENEDKEMLGLNTDVVILDDPERKRLLSSAPLKELEEVVKRLSFEQANELARYALEKNMIDLRRAEIIKRVTRDEVDILSMYRLKQQIDEVLPGDQ